VSLVSTNTHDTADPDIAGIKLNVERYMQLFRLIGCDTYTKIAAETGVTLRHIRRARRGGVVGGVFMAQTIAALRRHADRLAEYGQEPPTLDDLFTVEPRRA